MALSIDHHLHFRCVFKLCPAPGAEALWSDIPPVIRHWIGNRADQDSAFLGNWLYAGGTWMPPGSKRFAVRSSRCLGDGHEEAPQYWAVRYEHPDDEIAARQWRTDIGLTALPGNEILFALSTVNWIMPGFIGREPDPPLPSAPAIVGALLRDRRWCASAGTQPLVRGPEMVNEGHADRFRDRVFDSGRRVPLLLISKQVQTGKPLLDSVRLARFLAGTATVYESETTVVDKELEYLLDPDYRCGNGRVRVYQTDADPNRSGDSKRHRYFTGDDIISFGASAVEDMLVRGIVRRSQVAATGGVANLEDVAAKQQEEHLEKLRASLPGTKEWIIALESDNRRQADELRKKQVEVDMWYGEAERLQSVEEDVAVLEFRNRALSDETKAAKDQADLLEKQAEIITALGHFPKSVVEVIDFVERAFPGRLIFTEKARESAKDASIQDLDAVWCCLRDMAIVLFPLHLEKDLPLREIAKVFTNQTGYELATTESESTRNNKKLRSLRKLNYKGIDIDTTTHVKYGNKPGKCLRVHYGLLEGERSLIIGHCGDHLETSSKN